MTNISTLARITVPHWLEKIDQPRMVERMADFGMRRAHVSEIGGALSLGESLINASLAQEQVVQRVDRATGMTVWVTGDPLEGLYLIIPLTEAGEDNVRKGKFEPSNPSPQDICSMGEPCFGIYVGIYAGRTKTARRNIMQASATLRIELFGNLPCFARAATEDGARSMIGLGFEALDGSLADIYVHEAMIDRAGFAA